MRSHNRPQTDILRSYAVGVVFVTTLLTAEMQALPVRCRDVTTSRASSGCVIGVDHLRFDTHSSSLILDKELSLCVRPPVDFGSEVLPFTQRTVSYVRQVLQADRSCTVRDSVAHQLLGCSMEHRYRYGCLMAAHASEKTPRALGANGLDGRAFASDTRTAVVFHPSLEKECSVICRVGSDHKSLDAEVASDEAPLGLGFWNLDFVGQAEEPLVAYALDLGVFPPGLGDRGMLQDTGRSENGDAFLVLQKIAPVGQWDCGTLVNAQRPTPLGLLCLVAGCDLSEQRAGQLGWDTKLLADDRVESAGKTIRVQFLRLKHLFGNPASRSKIFERDTIHMGRLSNPNLDCADCFQYKTT